MKACQLFVLPLSLAFLFTGCSTLDAVGAQTVERLFENNSNESFRFYKSIQQRLDTLQGLVIDEHKDNRKRDKRMARIENEIKQLQRDIQSFKDRKFLTFWRGRK